MTVVGDRIDLGQVLRAAIGNTVVACCCYGELPRGIDFAGEDRLRHEGIGSPDGSRTRNLHLERVTS